MKVRKLLLKPYAGKSFLNNNVFSVNNGNNIFAGIKGDLIKKGVDINTIDSGNIGDSNCVIFCDIPYPWEIKSWLLLLMNRKKSVLFCFESPLINPFSHLPSFFVFFNTIYTWNDRLVDEHKIRKLYLPVVDYNRRPQKTKFSDKKLLCIVSGNKSAPLIFKVISPFKKDLYIKRIEVIRYFEKNDHINLGLYGKGWNEPKKFSIKEKLLGYKPHISYKGLVPMNIADKLKVISKYKFYLCFENCVADGYLSEKIIDCFKAGVVPIYWGDPNISRHFPASSFIDFRNYKNLDSLYRYISQMKESEHRKYVENGSKIVNNPKFKDKWMKKGFIRIIQDAISSVQ